MKRIRRAVAAWRLRRSIDRAKRVLDRIDLAMVVAGLSRQERRRIKRELYAGRLSAQDLV